jgi:hypothetical protein
LRTALSVAIGLSPECRDVAHSFCTRIMHGADAEPILSTLQTPYIVVCSWRRTPTPHLGRLRTIVESCVSTLSGNVRMASRLSVSQECVVSWETLEDQPIRRFGEMLCAETRSPHSILHPLLCVPLAVLADPNHRQVVSDIIGNSLSFAPRDVYIGSLGRFGEMLTAREHITVHESV